MHARTADLDVLRSLTCVHGDGENGVVCAQVARARGSNSSVKVAKSQLLLLLRVLLGLCIRLAASLLWLLLVPRPSSTPPTLRHFRHTTLTLLQHTFVNLLFRTAAYSREQRARQTTLHVQRCLHCCVTR